MCKTVTAYGTKSYQEKKYSLAEFFDLNWSKYLESPKQFILPEQFKAVNAICRCRTPYLGKDIYACKDCGEIKEIYHSCKNRFCPTCSWSDTVKWGEKLKQDLLKVPHRHIVMTLPHSLNGILKRNRKLLYDALMRISANLMKEYLLKRYGVKAGIVSVLHTYGEQKNYHVHVHMIVSWGGIDKDNLNLRPVLSKNADYNRLKEDFRNLYLAELIKLNNTGKLLHSFSGQVEFDYFLDELKKHKWIINLEPPMDIPEKVIRYIGRYSKRACLSEYKITKMEGEFITFRYKDYKDKDSKGKAKEKDLELHFSDFFPRLLQHVVMKNFRIVRYYGIYANRNRIPSDCKNGQVEKDDQDQKKIEYTDTKECPECKGKMTYVETRAVKGSLKWFIYKKKELKKLEKMNKKIAA